MAIFKSSTGINSVQDKSIKNYLMELNENLTYMFQNLTPEDNNAASVPKLTYVQDGDKAGRFEISADGIITQLTDADNIVATINMSSEGISILADKISIEGLVTANENFWIDEEGSMGAKNGTFSGTITASTLTGSTIKTSKLESSNIESAIMISSEIKSTKLTAAEISSSEIESTTMTASTINSSKLVSAEISSSDITSTTMTASTINSTKLVSAEISSSDITSTTMTASTITSTKLSAAEISSSDITSTTMTASEINSSKLSAAEIMSSEIKSTTMTASDISSTTMTLGGDGTQGAMTVLNSAGALIGRWDRDGIYIRRGDFAVGDFAVSDEETYIGGFYAYVDGGYHYLALQDQSAGLGDHPDYFFWAGGSDANPPFRVNQNGHLYCTNIDTNAGSAWSGYTVGEALKWIWANWPG